MSTSFVAKRALKFPDEMLVQLALGASPEPTVEEYGYIYDEIKDQPHFLVQFNRIEAELFQEGAITKVIAGAALHQVVENVAQRVLDPRIPTSDLLKAGEFLKKVKDEGSDRLKAASKPQFVIEINFPDGTSATMKEVQTLENDVPLLEVDDEDLPEGVMDAYREDHDDKFGVDFGSN